MTVAIQHSGSELDLPADNLPDRQGAAVARLADWAQSAQAAYQVAQSLVKTSFVPEAFRNKPHEATAAILAGLELDFSPMASLRAFDIIQGTAAPRAMTLRAVVQSKGHEVWVEDSTATRAVVCGRRAGSDRVERSVWTIDRAQKMGLTGKHNWKVQPQAMLIARGTSEVCRLIASDAILGVPYSSEELADGADVDLSVSDSAPVPAPTTDRPRTARRQPLKSVPPPAEPDFDEPAATPDPVATVAEPDFDDAEPVSVAPAESDAEAEAVPMVTQAQQRKMHALFREVGMDSNDRDARLRYVGEVLDREVGSSKELTLNDAKKVIDALERWAQASQPTAEEIADVVGEQR